MVSFFLGEDKQCHDTTSKQKKQDRQCSLVLRRGELEKRKFVNVYLENANSSTAVCETYWISNVHEILTNVINNDDSCLLYTSPSPRD